MILAWCLGEIIPCVHFRNGPCQFLRLFEQILVFTLTSEWGPIVCGFLSPSHFLFYKVCSWRREEMPICCTNKQRSCQSHALLAQWLVLTEQRSVLTCILARPQILTSNQPHLSYTLDISFLLALKASKWDQGTWAWLQIRVKCIPSWPFAQRYNFQLWVALNFENHLCKLQVFRSGGGIVSALQATGIQKTKTNPQYFAFSLHQTSLARGFNILRNLSGNDINTSVQIHLGYLILK